MMKHPKDLKLKVGSEEEVFWTRVKTASEQDMKDAKNSILLNEELVRVAEAKLKALAE